MFGVSKAVYLTATALGVSSVAFLLCLYVRLWRAAFGCALVAFVCVLLLHANH